MQLAFAGVEAAVVDANNLGKVDIIGMSDGVLPDKLCAALAPNPAGNGDERTPVVVVPAAAVPAG